MTSPITFTDYGDYRIAILYARAKPSLRERNTWLACARLLEPLIGPAAEVEVRLGYLGKRRPSAAGKKARWTTESFETWCLHASEVANPPDHMTDMTANRPSWKRCLAAKLPPEATVILQRCLALNREYDWSLLLASRTGIDVVALARTLVPLVDAHSLRAVRGPYADRGLKRGKTAGEGMSHALDDWNGHVPAIGLWKHRLVPLPK
jgi:hypothetical protein